MLFMEQIFPVPLAPHVMKALLDAYRVKHTDCDIPFGEYLKQRGVAFGVHRRKQSPAAPAELSHAILSPLAIKPPFQTTMGTFRMIALLVDFKDRPQAGGLDQFHQLLFSTHTYPGGSLNDYFRDVSGGKVSLDGTVHGWLRLPESYDYYVDGQSGMGENTYPRNTQGLMRDALHEANKQGITFDLSLDNYHQKEISGLILIHAGQAGEMIADDNKRIFEIQSHQWVLPAPITVSAGLVVQNYAIISRESFIGTYAHEVGHLLFGWEDCYDTDKNNEYWDGSGRWDLMAGGCWNDLNPDCLLGRCPARPAALHRVFQKWPGLRVIGSAPGVYTVSLTPCKPDGGQVVKVKSRMFQDDQYLLLENRQLAGYDAALPGYGLLVWRVDESQGMGSPEKPGLYLIQADGNQNLDYYEGDACSNDGDAGDPFPGSSNRRSLTDSGPLSTSFPGQPVSGIIFENINHESATGEITVTIRIR